MRTNQTVIGADAIYIGDSFAHHTGRRVRILEIERFDMPESEIDSFTLPKMVITSDAELKRHGGLKPTDRFTVGLLNTDGKVVGGMKYRVPTREVALTSLPATAQTAELPGNWHEVSMAIARRFLSVEMLEAPGLAEALAAAYLAGASAD